MMQLVVCAGTLLARWAVAGESDFGEGYSYGLPPRKHLSMIRVWTQHTRRLHKTLKTVLAVLKGLSGDKVPSIFRSSGGLEFWSRWPFRLQENGNLLAAGAWFPTIFDSNYASTHVSWMAFCTLAYVLRWVGIAPMDCDGFYQYENISAMGKWEIF